MTVKESYYNRQTTFRFKNVSGETAPPFAVMEIGGFVDGSFLISKPSSPNQHSSKLCFNGRLEVQSGSFGDCFISPPCYAIFDSDIDGTTIESGGVGTRMRPLSGSWKMVPDTDGFFSAGTSSFTSDGDQVRWITPRPEGSVIRSAIVTTEISQTGGGEICGAFGGGERSYATYLVDAGAFYASSGGTEIILFDLVGCRTIGEGTGVLYALIDGVNVIVEVDDNSKSVSSQPPFDPAPSPDDPNPPNPPPLPDPPDAPTNPPPAPIPPGGINRGICTNIQSVIPFNYKATAGTPYECLDGKSTDMVWNGSYWEGIILACGNNYLRTRIWHDGVSWQWISICNNQIIRQSPFVPTDCNPFTFSVGLDSGAPTACAFNGTFVFTTNPLVTWIP